MSLNKVMLIGRLGRDPELRYLQNGTATCSLSLATDESYQDRDGNKVDRTEWHRVSAFQRAAENCANYLVKGSLVYVEGSLQTRKWTDKQGEERYTTEIKAQRVQFLDRKGGENGAVGQSAGGTAQNTQRRPPAARPQQPQHGEDLGPAFPSESSGMDEVPFR